MKTSNFKGLFLLSILLSFFLLSGCGGEDVNPIRLTMKNNSSEETHLWANSEGIDPSNKLAPGASRSHTITWVQKDGEPRIDGVDVTVYAGRNGATLTSKTFTVMVEQTYHLDVVYSGGALSSAQ